MKRKPLEVLGLAPGADEVAITAAYRRLCMVHHPDRGGSHEAFVELKQAKELAIKQIGRSTMEDQAFNPGTQWRGGFADQFEEYLCKTYGEAMFRTAQARARSNQQAQEHGRTQRDTDWGQQSPLVICPKCRNTIHPVYSYVNDEYHCPLCSARWTTAWNRKFTKKDRATLNPLSCTACQDTGYIELTKGLSTMRLRCPTCLDKPKGEKK